MKRGREEEDEEEDSDASEQVYEAEASEASDDGDSAYEHDVDDIDGASAVPLVQQLLEDIQGQLQVSECNPFLSLFFF